MLEQEIRRKIFKRLEVMDGALGYDIESLCECRSVIREVLMLYYYDHKDDLNES